MHRSRRKIADILALRAAKGDTPTILAVNFKNHPDKWHSQPYSSEALEKIYHLPTVGVKLKFKFTTLTIRKL